MAESLRDILDFLTETAYLAGRKTLAYYQTGVQADYKADRSPVTLADRAAEELIRGRVSPLDHRPNRWDQVLPARYPALRRVDRAGN